MITYTWKILELKTARQHIVEAKYFCEATKDGFKVATEGNWVFRKKPEIVKDLSEHLVSHWVDLDAQEGSRHLIKTRLDEQLQALENAENRDPPWKVETFKVTL